MQLHVLIYINAEKLASYNTATSLSEIIYWKQDEAIGCVTKVDVSRLKVHELDRVKKMITGGTKKKKVLSALGTESQDKQIPNRQYYHSRTNLPMLEGDWEMDSDDEPDEVWLHKMGEEVRGSESFLYG